MSNVKLRGFYRPELAKRRAHAPAVSRPDLVAKRNAETLGIKPYKVTSFTADVICKLAPPHYATTEAPNSWEALQAWDYLATLRAVGHGESIVMPVFEGGSELSIYPSARCNHAFRAWHDYTHLRLGLGFSYRDELRVAMAHRRHLRNIRPTINGEDILAVWFDTAGQIHYYRERGQYVHNQALFVAACFEVGIREACSYVW